MQGIPKKYTNVSPDRKLRYTLEWMSTDAAGYHTYILRNYRGTEVILYRLTAKNVIDIMNDMHGTFTKYSPYE